MRAKAFVARIIAVVCALSLLPATALAETYRHGYLDYEVADHSITVVGYAGKEKTVTIPNMIGGDPVNVIASGAFANAPDVAVIYLPSSVVTVEQGAFAVGQAVIFASDVAQPAQNAPATEGTAEASAENVPANSDTAVASQTAAVPGIRTANGSLMAVDGEGHLLYVDASGTEYVVDDTRTYTRDVSSDGTVTIRNDAGEAIAVSSDGSTVSFADAEGRNVAVNAATGVTTVNDADGTFSVEEATIEEDATDAQAQPAAKSPDAPVAIIVAAVVAVLGVAAFLIWKRKQAADQKA